MIYVQAKAQMIYVQAKAQGSIGASWLGWFVPDIQGNILYHIKMILNYPQFTRS